MSFLNAALAFGGLAFAIPLAIHLFFRSRFKTLDWGAMYLLDSVLRVNRRRLQLTNILLLLLRCLIPVLLAFCLARPVWTGMRALAGDAPKTLVVAIDDSRSMSASEPGKSSRIETAKREIRQLLNQLSRRDEVILIRSSRLGAVPGKMGVSDALTKLRKIDSQGDRISLGKLLEAAKEASEDGTHARRQILLVSDFQSDGVDTSTLEVARQISLARKEQAEVGGDETLVIDFLNVAGDWDELSNVSVDAVSVDSPVVVALRAGVYTATIRNASELPANDLRLVWSIDGEALEPRVVSVDAKSSVTNRLTHTIDQSGTHEVTATIDRGDALIEDNRRSVAVDVMDEIDVVLIDGKPGKRPLQGQADYLSIALSPFAFGGDDRPDPVRASVVQTKRLGDTLDEKRVSVIILAGVGRLADSELKRITDFVHGGGALIVFDGPEVKPDLYNKPWQGEGTTLTFPAELGEVIGASNLESTGGGPDVRVAATIDKPAAMYQPWGVLQRGGENPFSDVSLFAFRRLLVEGRDDGNGGGDGTVVLLETVDQSPLVVMKTVGEGAVVQVAFPGTETWSNLPLRPVFLPLIQQLVLDLAGKGQQANVAVGQPIVIASDQWPSQPQGDTSAEPSGKVTVRYSARTPMGEFELNPPPGDDPIRLTSTYAPGVYRLQKRVGEIGDEASTQVFETVRVATVDAAESRLVGATEDRLQSVSATLDAGVFTSAADLQRTDRSRAFGREIWRWLLALLLIALVLELWLQQNLVSRRRFASVAAGGGGTGS